jgi:hypothetical protein
MGRSKTRLKQRRPLVTSYSGHMADEVWKSRAAIDVDHDSGYRHMAMVSWAPCLDLFPGRPVRTCPLSLSDEKWLPSMAALSSQTLKTTPCKCFSFQIQADRTGCSFHNSFTVRNKQVSVTGKAFFSCYTYTKRRFSMCYRQQSAVQ